MYKVLDLFCGAGGLSLGFENAGFKIVGGVDFDKAAMETHKHNFKSNFEVCGDISEITDDEIIGFRNSVDVIVGGPPCQGFSSANRYAIEEEDPRNRLFFEYIRFVRIINPKMFVIENVPGILSRNEGYAKRKIIEITEQLGYDVKVQVLSSDDFGVPQKRNRAFFVGVRKDLKVSFDFSLLCKIDQKRTVEEAIGDLVLLEEGENFNSLNEISRTEFQNYFYDETSPTIANHDIPKHNDVVVERIKHVPQGGNWKDVPDHLWNSIRTNRHSSAYRRLDYSKPSITIDTGHMNYFHPIFHRVPTVRESARIQSFKDSFVFKGNKTEQYRQVGNAVPPLLAQAIAHEMKLLLEEGEENNEYN